MANISQGCTECLRTFDISGDAPGQDGNPTSISRSIDNDAPKPFYSFRERLRQFESNSNGALLPSLGKIAGLRATLSLLRAHVRWKI